MMLIVLISRYRNYKLNQAVCIPNIGDVRSSALYVYSDDSFATLAGCSSQGGYVIFLKGENGKASPLVWTSNKLELFVKSQKAAETLSMQLAAEYAFLLESVLIEVYKLDKSSVLLTTHLFMNHCTLQM